MVTMMVDEGSSGKKVARLFFESKIRAIAHGLFGPEALNCRERM
jgi:hypothetical protein